MNKKIRYIKNLYNKKYMDYHCNASLEFANNQYINNMINFILEKSKLADSQVILTINIPKNLMDIYLKCEWYDIVPDSKVDVGLLRTKDHTINIIADKEVVHIAELHSGKRVFLIQLIINFRFSPISEVINFRVDWYDYIDNVKTTFVPENFDKVLMVIEDEYVDLDGTYVHYDHVKTNDDSETIGCNSLVDSTEEEHTTHRHFIKDKIKDFVERMIYEY